MKPQDWNELADQVISKNAGNDPLSIMTRASWEHSKTTPEMVTSVDEWNELVRGDISAQLDALVRAGYRLIHLAGEERPAGKEA